MKTSESTAKLPTKYGLFTIHAFQNGKKNENLALTRGNLKNKKNVLTRIQSECLTGEVFCSTRCDCQEQLTTSLQLLGKEQNAILIYLRQEGRGIGLFQKINAYHLQDKGLDTVEANQKLGFAPDKRDYADAAKIISKAGIKSIKLLTNNPEKVKDLKKHGIVVTEMIPLLTIPTAENKRYLQTKKEKLGQVL